MAEEKNAHKENKAQAEKKEGHNGKNEQHKEKKAAETAVQKVHTGNEQKNPRKEKVAKTKYVTPIQSSNPDECTDIRCPRHGNLRTRGRIFEGKVVSTKAQKTAVVEIQNLRKVQKYERYEKRRSKLHVHIPNCNKVNEGDIIKFMECRKISKTKSFVIIDK